MPMGTMQLIFIGPQNLFITENPQITFFKTVYKRHTNFAIDTIQEFFDGTVDFGNQIKCKLGKNGDLLGRMGMYIKLSSLSRCVKNIPCKKDDSTCLCTCYKCLLDKNEEPLVYGWANAIGHVLLEWIEMYIGGQLIDRHYGEWLEIWTELSQTAEKRSGYYEMIGKKDPISYTVDSFTGEMELYVPFAFWFCRNIGLAIPVLCLYYHDIEFQVKLRDFNQCWVCNKCNCPSPKAKIDACILAEYIYLSIEERRKFYSESHLYLIEQVQLNHNNCSDCNIGNLNIQMDFNHPVKELIWILQRQDVVGPPCGVWPEDCSYPRGNDHFNFTSSRIPRLDRLKETFTYAKIILDGVDRTVYWPASFFRLWKNYFYHTRIPTANYIYVYPFGFTPEEHQPSGECNMSRIDNAQLVLRLMKKHHACEIYPIHARIYATNYNILFITGGMGGIMFEN